MHVAWIVYGGLDAKTGGTIYDRVIVEGLRARGSTVSVIALRMRGRLRGLLAADDLVARVAALHADVLVGDELCFAELGAAFAQLPRMPRVLLTHHLSCWEPERAPLARALDRLLERWALRVSDRIIATSHATAERLEREERTGAVTVIHPGCDRLPRGVRNPSPTTRLLFVGTWTERKGLLRLLHALGGMSPDGWSLSIVGEERDPLYAAKVHEALSGLRHCDIRVLGRMDDEPLAKAYDAHDVLVLPTSFEGFGMVIGEALFAGLDVITTNAGATVEASFGSPRVVYADDDLQKTLRLRIAGVRSAAQWDSSVLPTWQQAIDAFGAALAATLG